MDDTTQINTEIIIKANDIQIGAIQSISYNEYYSDSIKVSGNCTRVRFDNIKIKTAFSRGIVEDNSQLVPFNIIIIDDYVTGDCITTVLKNVWFRKFAAIYSAADVTIAEGISWDAECVISEL